MSDYVVTGNETEVLIPRPQLGAVRPAHPASWHRVAGFVYDDKGERVIGVHVVCQPLMRRAHVVLDGR